MSCYRFIVIFGIYLLVNGCSSTIQTGSAIFRMYEGPPRPRADVGMLYDGTHFTEGDWVHILYARPKGGKWILPPGNNVKPGEKMTSYFWNYSNPSFVLELLPGSYEFGFLPNGNILSLDIESGKNYAYWETIVEYFAGGTKKRYYNTFGEYDKQLLRDWMYQRSVFHLKNGKLVRDTRTGTFLLRDKEGRKAAEVELVDGFTVRETRWYDNGNKYREAHLERGLLHGPLRLWYPNGQLKQEVGFQAYQHGEAKYWFENGQLQEHSNWNFGKQDGLTRIWYENGQQKEFSNWQNGRSHGLQEKWYDNGQKFYSGKKTKGKSTGVWKYWHKNGKQKEISQWDGNGLTGEQRIWYENGQQKSITSFKNSLRHGTEKEWHDNGQLKSIGHYDNGKRDGVFEEWDSAGNLLSRKEWKK